MRPTNAAVALLAPVLVLGACSGDDTAATPESPAGTDAPTEHRSPAPEMTSPPAPGPTATGTGATACDQVGQPSVQESRRLDSADDEPPEPYSSTPGTSGARAPGAPRTGVFTLDDPLTEPELVNALANGQVVAAYDPQRFGPVERDMLEEQVRRTYADDVTVTPFTERPMDAPLVLNAWGARQRCDQFDPTALAAFVANYADSGPDAG